MDTQRIPEPPTIGPGMISELGADLDPVARRKIAEKALQWSRYFKELESQSEQSTTREGLLFSHLDRRLERTEDMIHETSNKIDKTADSMMATVKLCQSHRDKRISRLTVWVFGLTIILGALCWGGQHAADKVIGIILKLVT